MDIVAAIAAANGLLQALDYLLDDQTKAEARKALNALIAAGPSLEKLEEWTKDTLDRAVAAQERRIGLRAQASNPAFSKNPSVGGYRHLGALLLALCLSIGATGCFCKHGQVRVLEETEEYRAGYYVVWPADVMADEAAFRTEYDPEGRWVTSVPKADAITPSN